jgi:cell division protein ZapA (FtsZ GTPase activity inhibitor)
MNTLKKFKVSIFGDSYVLVSDEAEEHFNLSVQKVDALMRQVAAKSEVYDPKRIAVLVAVQLASQLKNSEERLVFYGSKEEELSELIDRELTSAMM